MPCRSLDVLNAINNDSLSNCKYDVGLGREERCRCATERVVGGVLTERQCSVDSLNHFISLDAFGRSATRARMHESLHASMRMTYE